MGRISDKMWELYNEYSIKGVLIISRSDFEREIERIDIQLSEKKHSHKTDSKEKKQ